MNWIRVAVGIQDDPKSQALADAVRVRLPHAVGMVVCTLVQLPDHARDGNLRDISASTLERWAGWHGKAGAFDAAFRRVFCVNDTVAGWEKHNGAAIREADRNAKKARDYRDRQRKSTGDVPGDVPGDVTAYETGRDETVNKAVRETEVRCSTSRGPVPLSDVVAGRMSIAEARRAARRGVA